MTNFSHWLHDARVSIASLLIAFALACTIANSIYSQGPSIELSPGVHVPLATSALSGVDSNQQSAVLARIAGDDGWEKFSKATQVAPVRIQVQPVLDTNQKRIGHDIRSAFVLHGSLETLKNQELLETIFGKSSEQGFQIRELTKLELDSVSITEEERKKSRFLVMEFPLLQRVQITSMLRMQMESTSSQIQANWYVDRRWEGKIDSINQYAILKEDDFGKKRAQPPVPYYGMGGSLFVTQLEQPTTALLVESQLVLFEPEEWFHGSNQLRSKLPLTFQENARTFRRRVMSAKTEK